MGQVGTGWNVGLAAGLSILALAAATTASAAQDPCSRDLAGQIADPAYRFAYQSWSRKVDGAYLFTNCVRNDAAGRAVWISWKAAGLEGFVAPGRDIYTITPFEDDRRIGRSEALYYGSLPRLTHARTIIHTDSDRVAEAPPGLIRAAFTPEEAADDTAAARFRVFIPVAATGQDEASQLKAILAAPEPERRSRFTAFVESHPGLLNTVAMSFTYRVVRDGRGGASLAYQCDYRVGDGIWTARPREAGDDGLSLHVRFSDPALQRLMFGDRPESVDLRTWTGQKWADKHLHGEASNIPVSRLRRQASTVDILIGNGRTLVGSMPLAYVGVAR